LRKKPYRNVFFLLLLGLPHWQAARPKAESEAKPQKQKTRGNQLASTDRRISRANLERLVRSTERTDFNDTINR